LRSASSIDSHDRDGVGILDGHPPNDLRVFVQNQNALVQPVGHEHVPVCVHRHAVQRRVAADAAERRLGGLGHASAERLDDGLPVQGEQRRGLSRDQVHLPHLAVKPESFPDRVALSAPAGVDAAEVEELAVGRKTRE